jgi:NAD(P)-dependent dehydrogenase (short-subunit alcohol dehydrogenase family)
MDLNLGGKLALITGGSRGIGRAVGEALAAEGCNLVLVSRSAVDLDTARRHLEREYRIAVRTDVADLADSTNVTRLAEQFPGVDILVNNAGAIPGGTLFEVDEVRWRTAWDLKVLGTINMTRAFYPLMKARGGGAIINIIGNAARSHDPGYICVIGVSPGPTATDRVVGLASKRAQERFGDPSRWPELFKSLPRGGVGEPGEIAAMVAFLASPKSSNTSGVVFTLDAGASSRAGRSSI